MHISQVYFCIIFAQKNAVKKKKNENMVLFVDAKYIRHVLFIERVIGSNSKTRQG